MLNGQRPDKSMSKPMLKPGDQVRVIAPSGALRTLEPLQQGLDIWRSRGYQVELSSGLDRQWGYLAGTDQERCYQLLDALADDTCRVILCARGGYGATRLLESLNPQPFTFDLALNPKFLLGFSDVTALLWGLRDQVLGLHGPVLTTLAQEPQWSIHRVFDYLEKKTLEPLQGQGWGWGQTEGWLLPGNLTVATHLLGTPYQPNFTGAILAFEDVNEEPYRIDRMLTQWRMMGIFQQIQGMALGRFSHWEKQMHPNSFKLEEVLRDRLGDLGIPIVSDLPFGHDGPNALLPVGIPVCLDGDQGILSFPESNVSLVRDL
ncbi:MAG: S66 peptidase family protein [Microcoleaceae cyanobacterium]